MDDNKFDDLIKSKVGNYEDPSFDPSALAALHNRLATESDWPWHVRYRTEIMVGSAAAVIVLFTLWGQWYFTGQTENMQKELNMWKAQNEKIEGLLAVMKNYKTPAPDTIRMIEIRDRDPFLYAHLVQQIEDLKTALGDSIRVAYNRRNSEQHSLTVTDRELYAGVFDSPFGRHKFSRFVLLKPDSTPIKNEALNTSPKKLTAKEIKKKENYRKGIGFRLGVTGEVSQGLYPAGVGEPFVGYGILGDFILSPSLSFETGLKYAQTFYAVRENEFHKIDLPSVDPTIGNLKKAEIDSWILEIPLNLKYRLPVSMRTSFLTRIGYSPMIYTGQIFEYSYEYDAVNNLVVNDTHKQRGLQFYPGVVNLSIGGSYILKNKKIIEAGIHYQQGLGKMGIEKNRSGYLGIRGVYWIPLR